MRAIPTQAAICHSSTTTLTCRTYNLVEPGKGNALHTHPSVEIFIALDGKWEIAWGGRGEHTMVLQPWDMIAVPAHVRHSYKNVEEKTANHIMTILCGDASITWGPDVVAEARNHGVRCTRRCCFTCAYRLPSPEHLTPAARVGGSFSVSGVAKSCRKRLGLRRRRMSRTRTTDR